MVPYFEEHEFPLTAPTRKSKVGLYLPLQRLKFYSSARLEIRENIGLSVVPHCKAVTVTGFFNPHVLGSN